MTVTKLPAVIQQNIVEHVVQLERAGAITAVSLDITNPDYTYDLWESLGRFFGQVGRSNYWWIGDWLIFGEAVYGHDAANAVDATTKGRYDLAERVTGLEPQTLMNIRSVCARVAKPRRRIELGFWIHQEVAPLDPGEQSMWLQAAIDNGWTKNELREKIRGKKVTPPEPDGDEGGGHDEDHGPTPAERVKSAALLLVRSASVTSDGDWLVPANTMQQLAASIGEEMR